jgi:Ca2+-transporting ATPase
MESLRSLKVLRIFSWKDALGDEHHHLQRQVNIMAEEGQRVLGFAYRYWEKLPTELSSDEHETDLYFLGLAGIIDPPREEVSGAVEECKRAGIIPVMITGDHPLTARSIAERIVC